MQLICNCLCLLWYYKFPATKQNLKVSCADKHSLLQMRSASPSDNSSQRAESGSTTRSCCETCPREWLGQKKKKMWCNSQTQVTIALPGFQHCTPLSYQCVCLTHQSSLLCKRMRYITKRISIMGKNTPGCVHVMPFKSAVSSWLTASTVACEVDCSEQYAW